MRTKSFFTAVFVVVALCLIQTTVHGDDIKTGPRPGESNPSNMTRPTLFQDDEVLVLTGLKNMGIMNLEYLYPTNDDLINYNWNSYQTTSFPQYGSDSQFRHMAAASGRVLYPDRWDTAVYASFRPDGKVGVGWWDPQSGQQDTHVTLDGTQVSDRSVDVAVGDLDQVVDGNGMYHDEIVVVRTYQFPGAGGKDVAIDVLDYNLNILGSDKFFWPDCANMVAVGIGDFNDDGYPEIAVGMATHTATHTRQVTIYRIARNQDGSLVTPLKLERVSNWYAQQSAGHYNGAFDLTVGDFDGDGKDEIYLVSAISVDDPPTSPSSLDHTILRADKDLNLGVAWSSVDSHGYIPMGQVRTQSGLFKFDPGNGWNLNRRQIVTCFVNGPPPPFNGLRTDGGHGLPNFIACEFYSFQGNPADGSISRISNDGHGIEPNPVSFFSDIDIAVGNYVGHGQDGKQTSPLMDLVVGFSECNVGSTPPGKYTGANVINVYSQDYWGANHSLFYYHGSDYINGVEPSMPMAATAIDGDGDTWRLGPPMHLTIENLIGLDYVVQEPPKHVDYLPKIAGNPASGWDVINVSAFREFNVEFVDSESVSFSTSSTNNSSHSIGGSVELDVKATVSKGIGDIAKVSLSGESDTKISYNYESSKSSYDSQYASRTTSFTSRTEIDDFIAGKIQLVDIWRYPILGYKTDDKKNYGFQEIILPGPLYAFKTGGLDNSDWYQPVHQNHNLLSYPSIRTQPFPPDLGPFTLPDGTVVNDTMNSMDIHSFSGTSQTIAVSWTSEAGSGSEKSYNHTLSESEDIKIGISAKSETPQGSAKVEASVSLSFNNTNSWGGSETEEAKNSESEGITINVPSGDSNNAYTFKSAVYVSSGEGPLKVAHAADPLGSTAGQSWWKLQYGNAPDPGLNLLNRFIWHLPSGDNLVEYWTLNEDDSRMEMRGFFMRKSTPNPVSGEYDILGSPPTDGDKVQLCARVYNFSLSKPTGVFNVLLEYVPYDDGGGKEAGSRVSVGTVSTTLAAITDPSNPSMKEVCVPWDTTGLSNTPYTYRFYVTVDPNDEVKNEIHEWKDASGNKILHGNNEGYWPWGTGIPVLKEQSQTQVQSVKPSVSMHVESLAIETPSGLKSKGPVRVFAHERYRLRAHIVANEDHPHHHYTVFFDGPPENGKVIALKTNWGVIDGDNYVWANWTPQETGEREIYVHFIEDSDEETKGDAWDSLKVVVRQEPISWKDEIIDRLMGVEE